MMIKIQVDDKEIEVDEGSSLLQTCLDNDIYIPNLCYLKEREKPSASCRICFVEIDGMNNPVASCTVKVKDGMVVRSDTDEIRRLQRAAFQLLMSVHDVDCGNCPANKQCPLQHIAKFLKIGLKPGRFESQPKESVGKDASTMMTCNPNRCILCGKCVYICKKKHGQSLMTFTKRGFDTIISFYGENDESVAACTTCRACIEICPVSALDMGN